MFPPARARQAELAMQGAQVLGRGVDRSAKNNAKGGSVAQAFVKGDPRASNLELAIVLGEPAQSFLNK
eukprot:8248592-Pyramimonas_sp.AAC.1